MARAFQGSSELTVNAGPERIWAILADSTVLPQWAPMVKATTGKTERVGSVRTCQVELDGRHDQVTERCIEALPNRKITWVMEQGVMTRLFSTVRFGFLLDPQGPNMTQLKIEFLYEPRHLPARLMYALIMRRKMEQLRQVLLENIKRLAEKRC